MCRENKENKGEDNKIGLKMVNVRNECGRYKGRREVQKSVLINETDEEIVAGKEEEVVKCPYIIELPPEGEIVQYKGGRNEEKRMGVINKVLVPEFDRLKLKRLMKEEERENMDQRK